MIFGMEGTRRKYAQRFEKCPGIFQSIPPKWGRVYTYKPLHEGESDEAILVRVQTVRDILHERFSANGSLDIVCNADMRVGEIRRFCKLQDEGQSLKRAAMTQLNLSARAYHRILKLARTIAKLAGSEEIQSTHLAEVLQYRPKIMLG